MGNEDLHGCWVIRNGRIRNGVFRVLSLGIGDDGSAETGSPYYSDELLSYSSPVFRLELDKEGDLFVFQGKARVAKISPDSIFWMNEDLSGPALVIDDGWLIPFSAEPLRRRVLANFSALKAGTLIYYSNTPFYKVEPSLKGEKLLLIVGERDHLFRVIDPETKQVIPAEVLYPFAREIEPGDNGSDS